MNVSPPIYETVKYVVSYLLLLSRDVEKVSIHPPAVRLILSRVGW